MSQVNNAGIGGAIVDADAFRASIVSGAAVSLSLDFSQKLQCAEV